MVGKDLLSNLSRTNHQRAEIVTDSRLALTELQSTRNWVLPIVKDIKRKAERVEEEGGRVVLTWLSSGNNCEGYEVANAAAQRAARQQPRAMRSASLSFVKHAVKEKWKTTTKLNKYIQNARKSVAARYLQLKSNHAVTGVHLLQTVALLMLECRKWRRERETMLQRLSARNVKITGRRDRRDLEILFEQDATIDVLQYIESTEVGKKLPDGTDKCDSWDIERLDREHEERTIGDEDRFGET
jgi:ribonuclease HI